MRKPLLTAAAFSTLAALSALLVLLPTPASGVIGGND